MSKAKELAREIKSYIDDANMGPRSKMLVAKLVGTVLSEPDEPETLKAYTATILLSEYMDTVAQQSKRIKELEAELKNIKELTSAMENESEIAILKMDLNLHQLELQALRDWKAKARPVLEYLNHKLIKEVEDQWVEGCEEDDHPDNDHFVILNSKLDELTELLGGDE